MNFSLIIYTSNKYMYGKTSDQKFVALIFSIFTHYMLNLITIIQLYNESSIWENYPQEMMLKTVYFKARVYAFFHPFFLPINSSAPQLRHHKKGRVPFGLRLQGFSQVADVQFSQQTLST